jgi:hypothetical protein
MDRVAPETDRQLLFAHYGSHPNGREILDLARQQLELWIRVISGHTADPDIESITKDLMERDPLFSRLAQLPSDMVERERFFIRNSINGILGYLGAS